MENIMENNSSQKQAENNVNKEASAVLGNSKTQYVDQYDPELLVTFSRNESLLASNVDIKYPYAGYDIWNMWEVSFLLDNGVPVHGVGKLVIDAKSERIIESKSMKLYFFSFSMYKLGATKEEAINKLIQLVEMDIGSRVGLEVNFNFREIPYSSEVPLDYDRIIESVNINNMVDVESLTIDKFTESPELLKVIKRDDIEEQDTTPSDVSFYSIPTIKTNCRVTHQADFATGIVVIKSDEYTIDPESLIKYIASFRKEYHFHEEATHMAYDRIARLMLEADPKAEVFVLFQYTRRGGIDINPIRSSSRNPFDDTLFRMLIDYDTPWIKTNQQ